MMQILLHAVLPSSCTENYASEYKICEQVIELYDSGFRLWIGIMQSYHQLNSIQNFIHCRIALRMWFDYSVNSVVRWISYFSYNDSNSSDTGSYSDFSLTPAPILNGFEL